MTFMVQFLTGRYRTMNDLPCNDVRVLHFAAEPKFPVTMFTGTSLPRVTGFGTTGPVDAHLEPGAIVYTRDAFILAAEGITVLTPPLVMLPAPSAGQYGLPVTE